MNLLSRHGQTLAFLGANPTSRVVDVARHLGVTESNAWHLIDDLVRAGALQRIKGGRQNSYQIVHEAMIEGQPSYSVGAFIEVCLAVGEPEAPQRSR